MMKRMFMGLALLAVVPSVLAAESSIAVQSVKRPIGPTFKSVVSALKHSGFKVVKKINISKNLGKAAKHFHWTDYNQNHLTGIRTVVFCNAKFANAISNADPSMMALCPLHVTLVQQGAWTRVEFVKPAVIAEGSRAEGVAVKLQEQIEAAIRKGIAAP